MAANSSIILTSLDFDSQRASLKTYLKEQAAFKDYDFDSSNMSVLLDILSYNTYLNTFYLNMVGSEMFLDSAQLRESVISHAKELNYIPRSFISASATIDIVINSTDEFKRLLVIPKGTPFVTRLGEQSFTFTTNENIVIPSSNSTFVASNVRIYEGIFLNETYSINYDNDLRFKINNKNVDISSISVTIIEDNGATVRTYERATSMFGLNSESEVFFIQPAVGGDTYEVFFGDGVVGRTPKNNSVLVLEYRASKGELPNGAKTFAPGSRIDDESQIQVTTVSPAGGGSVAESIQSIKYNAPRAFTTQERAITTEDYENLLKINFSEINAVVAYGGEELTPPQYGRVFIAIDLKDTDGLPKIKQDEYYRFLKSRASVGITPVFTEVDYTYIEVNSTIRYNINKSTLNPEDIRTIVTSSILNFAKTNLNGFNKTLRYSRFVKSIDDADQSIVSNSTDLKIVKYLNPKIGVPLNLTIDFKTSIEPIINSTKSATNARSFRSSLFRYQGLRCYVEDDGEGNINIVTTRESGNNVVVRIGSIDYTSGIVKLSNFNIESYEDGAFKLYATPKDMDITSTQNIILNIIEPDVNLSIEQIRE